MTANYVNEFRKPVNSYCDNYVPFGCMSQIQMFPVHTTPEGTHAISEKYITSFSIIIFSTLVTVCIVMELNSVIYVLLIVLLHV